MPSHTLAERRKRRRILPMPAEAKEAVATGKKLVEEGRKQAAEHIAAARERVDQVRASLPAYPKHREISINKMVEPVSLPRIKRRLHRRRYV